MNNFDNLVKQILENLPPVDGNTAGSGGSLGTFQTSSWQNNASGTPGTDKYNQGDFRRPVILGGKKKKLFRRPLIKSL